MERVARKLARKPTWLVDLGIDEDDAEEIIVAMRNTGLMETDMSLSSAAAATKLHELEDKLAKDIREIEIQKAQLAEQSQQLQREKEIQDAAKLVSSSASPPVSSVITVGLV